MKDAKKALRNILEYIGLDLEKWGDNATLIGYIENVQKGGE